MPDNLTTFYTSNLPHLTPIGGTFFVTFRVKDTLPANMMKGMRLQFLKEVSTITQRHLPRQVHKFEIAKARYRYFRNFDRRLDRAARSDTPLADPVVAKILTDKLHEFDGELYDLIAYCIMPNHVHLLISLANQTVDEEQFYLSDKELSLTYRPLHEVMRRIKGSSSRLINQYLGRTGTAFWQKDSYDHFVRNARSFENIWWYILNNPVKAGLVAEVRDFKHTYWRVAC
jgi:REP element-mobilizing transposase RayT